MGRARANVGAARIVTLLAVAGVTLAAVLIARGSGASEAQADILPPCVPPLNEPPPVATANTPNPSEIGTNDPKQKVIFIGNNWEGTADIVATQGPKKFKTVSRINIVPDYTERVTEICLDPVDLGYFLAIRELVDELVVALADELVDDMYSTPDGKLLVVSRP